MKIRVFLARIHTEMCRCRGRSVRRRGAGLVRLVRQMEAERLEELSHTLAAAAAGMQKCVVCMWVRVVYVGACCVCGCVVCMWVRGVYVHVGLLLWRFRIHVQLVQQVCKECVYCV
jgi:hypothetical protein